MNTCQHKSILGDNYGTSCRDCGQKLSGYGYGGFFGRNINAEENICIHLWSSYGGNEEVCIYCERTRPVQVVAENIEVIAKRLAGKK